MTALPARLSSVATALVHGVATVVHGARSAVPRVVPAAADADDQENDGDLLDELGFDDGTAPPPPG